MALGLPPAALLWHPGTPTTHSCTCACTDDEVGARRRACKHTFDTPALEPHPQSQLLPLDNACARIRTSILHSPSLVIPGITFAHPHVCTPIRTHMHVHTHTLRTNTSTTTANPPCPRPYSQRPHALAHMLLHPPMFQGVSAASDKPPHASSCTHTHPRRHRTTPHPSHLQPHACGGTTPQLHATASRTTVLLSAPPTPSYPPLCAMRTFVCPHHPLSAPTALPMPLTPFWPPLCAIHASAQPRHPPVPLRTFCTPPLSS
ncbi:hypothetical protein K439DRAFT_1624256 [Ramaria rubella]|nr:hypothetical protein K439DRAFT_1624256 [Ramaria rubella]